MSFAELGLAEPIVRAVTESGYTQPTPIQAQAIPAVLKGGDLMAGEGIRWLEGGISGERVVESESLGP